MLLRRSFFAPRTKIFLLPYQQRRWGSGPAAGGGGDYQIGPANDVQPQPTTQHLGQVKLTKDNGEVEENKGGDKGDKGDKGDGKQQQQQHHDWKQSSWKALEAAVTTGVSLGVLGYVHPPPHMKTVD